MIITKQRNWYSWHTKCYVQALRNNIIEEDPLNVFSFFHDYAPRHGSKDARVICKKHWRALSANCMYSRNRSIGAFGAQNAVIENAGSICQRTYIFREDTRDLWTSGSHAPKGYTSARCGCSHLSLTPASLRCISAPQTLIRTNGTRVHALKNTERKIPREGAREQRPERDPDTDTGVLSGRSFPERAVSLETGRASCFHLARGWPGFCFVSIVAADSASLF